MAKEQGTLFQATSTRNPDGDLKQVRRLIQSKVWHPSPG
jgi:hypothetical protein